MKRCRKPWLRVKLVNFDFVQNRQVMIITGRISHPRSLCLIQGLRSLLLNLEFQKMSFFNFSHFSLYWKVYLSPWAIGSIKSSSTDYNKSNKPNSESVAHIGSEKLLVELGVPKNELFYVFVLLKSLLFHPKPWFPKMHYICLWKILKNFFKFAKKSWKNLDEIWIKFFGIFNNNFG